MKNILSKFRKRVAFASIFISFLSLNSCGYFDGFHAQDSRLESFTKNNAVSGKENMTNKLASYTVIIKRESEYSSGVIIAKQEAEDINTYFVLTTRHSVDTPPSKITIPEDEDINNFCPSHKQRRNSESELTCDFGNYYLTTFNNKVYAVDYSSIDQYSEQFDLALLKFESSENYRVAPIASIQQVSKGSPVFISGYRGCNNQQKFEMQDLYQLTSGYVKKDAAKSSDLFYTNSTIKGMSGAGVFDQQGKLIAIHKRANRDKHYNDKLCQSLEKEKSKLGDNWGTVISSQFIEENIPEHVRRYMKECTGIAQNSFC